MARRFAERGVRFVQVTHSDSKVQWDQHGDLKHGHEKNAREVDQPIAGLLTDLKARGLLEDTLVWWGGEFGRTPTVAGQRRPRPQPRRLHHVAGRRRRQGRHRATARPTTTATTPSRTRSTSTTCTPRILHLLGLDHERLTYRYAGRDFRLTDVEGNVVRDVFA